MMYKQLRKGLNNITLVPEDFNVRELIKENPKQDFYTSVYLYSLDQYNEFQKTNSIAGVKDVFTNLLVFDFDDKENPENARIDAYTLINRLKDKGIPESAIRPSFSGNKGYHVEVTHDDWISPEEHKNIATQLAGDLESFDTSVYDHARPFRVIGSCNQKSGLYKIPLTHEEIFYTPTEHIREIAKDLSNLKGKKFPLDTCELPASLKELSVIKKAKPKVELRDSLEIDWSKRPKDFPPCRWALYNGEFDRGERHEALMCLVSFFRNKGETEETAYHRGLGTIELQSKKYNTDEYDKKEFYDTCVKSVYSPDWKGGQYSCREEGSWLWKYCQSLGKHKCDHREEDSLKPRKLTDIQLGFKDYVKNIEQNTITTGLKSLDEVVFLSTGANVGIIGAPGSGKTSLALDILNNTSKAGVHSVFASLDMHSNRLFEKVLYRVSGKKRDEIYQIFKNDEEAELMEKLSQEFGNVHFLHKSSPTVSDVRDYIKACEDAAGEKIKLVMLDYFERVSTDVGDDTAASKKVAGELQDLVNDLNVCLITLVQPNKASLGGSADSPILSYTNIKGSSFVYQAFRIIVGLWRPFYNPKDFSNDKFMQMAVLKNDLGELAELNFGWNGHEGRILELDDYQEQELRELISKKEEARKANKDF